MINGVKQLHMLVDYLFIRSRELSIEVLCPFELDLAFHLTGFIFCAGL
jgi:hypothetical protein